MRLVSKISHNQDALTVIKLPKLHHKLKPPLHKKKRKTAVVSEETREIMAFFSRQILNHSDKYKPASLIPTDKENEEKKKQRIARLKQLTYGEVLTSEDVVQRLKMAEELQKNKKVKGTKLSCPIKKQVAKPKLKETVIKKGVKKIKTEKDVMGKPNPKGNSSNSLTIGNRKKKIKKEKEDSSESDYFCPIDTDDEDLDRTDLIAEFDSRLLEEVEMETANFEENIKIGKYVVVEVKGGSRKATNFKYVACITNVDEEDGDITVQGLRQSNAESTEFVEKVNDIFSVTIFEIVGVLPTPYTLYKNRQITYKFPGSVPVYRM